MENLEFLRNNILFEGMNDMDLRMVQEYLRPGFCRMKQMVFTSDDSSDSIYILKSGRVKIARITKDGKEIIMGMLKPNDVFGEMAIINQGPRGSFAEAQVDTYYYRIKLDDLYRLMKMKPAIIIRLTKVIGDRRTEVEKRMENYLFHGVRERLANLLIKLSDDFGIKDARGKMLRIKITHQDLANTIGSSRETVSLTLGDFRKSGLIEIKERKIIIKNLEGLESIS